MRLLVLLLPVLMNWSAFAQRMDLVITRLQDSVACKILSQDDSVVMLQVKRDHRWLTITQPKESLSGIWPQALSENEYVVKHGNLLLARHPSKDPGGLLLRKFGVGFPEMINAGVGLPLTQRHQIALNLGFVGIPGSETIYIFAIPSLEYRVAFGYLVNESHRFYWRNAAVAVVPASDLIGWGTAIGAAFGKNPKRHFDIDIGLITFFSSGGILVPTARLQWVMHKRKL